MNEAKKVAIFGYSQAKPEDQLYQDAFAVAKSLAEKGLIIVNGGGPGVMKAASEGAKAGGGKTIGVYFKPEGMTNFEGRDPTNHIDKEICLPNYVERTLKLLELADIYVILNGGTGTISEFAMAWGLARLFFGHHKPLVFIGSYWHEILEAFGKNMLLREEEIKVYRIVNNPQEAVTEILNLLSGAE